MSSKRSRRSVERTYTLDDPIMELNQEEILMKLSSGFKSRSRSVEQLPLPPGFRFSPTDEELVLYYLKNKAESKEFPIPVIACVDLYKFDPWKLPEEALFGEKEWYFFSPRERKYPRGDRPNRAAASGYWKATGTDKPIAIGKHRTKIGVKKSLVFYERKPKVKTNWIMHEYRLDETFAPSATRHHRGHLRLDDWVLCRIREKYSNHEQRQEHDMESMLANPTEFDDQLRSDSATQEEAVAETSTSMETMIPFSTSMIMNPAAITLARSNGWNNIHHLHEFVASTSHGHQMLGLQSTGRLPLDYMQYHPSPPSFDAKAAAATAAAAGHNDDSFFSGDDADGTPLPPLDYDYEPGSFSFGSAHSFSP